MPFIAPPLPRVAGVPSAGCLARCREPVGGLPAATTGRPPATNPPAARRLFAMDARHGSRYAKETRNVEGRTMGRGMGLTLLVALALPLGAQAGEGWFGHRDCPKPSYNWCNYFLP